MANYTYIYKELLDKLKNSKDIDSLQELILEMPVPLECPDEELKKEDQEKKPTVIEIDIY